MENVIIRKIYKDGIEVNMPETITINGVVYYGVFTDENLVAGGYEVKYEELPDPEPYLPTIEELVENALRRGADGGSPTYTINQEFEVQRKRDINKEAFDIYNARVEECITWANNQPHS